MGQICSTIRPELPSCILGHTPSFTPTSRAPESINPGRNLSISFDHTRFYPSVSKQMTLTSHHTNGKIHIPIPGSPSRLLPNSETRYTQYFPFRSLPARDEEGWKGRHKIPHTLVSRFLQSRALVAWGNEAQTKEPTQSLLLLFVFVTQLKHSVVAGLGVGVLLNSAYRSSAGAVPG